MMRLTSSSSWRHRLPITSTLHQRIFFYRLSSLVRGDDLTLYFSHTAKENPRHDDISTITNQKFTFGSRNIMKSTPSQKISFSQKSIKDITCIRSFSASTSPASSNEKDKKDRIKLTHITPQILNIQLSRPSKLNGLDMSMFYSLHSTLTSLQKKFRNKEEKTRAIILSGEGRAFCAGLDVVSLLKDVRNYRGNLEKLLQRPFVRSNQNDIENQMDEKENGKVVGEEEILAIGNLAQDVAYLWRSLPVPVIAVLHGVCYGGGMQIALGADMRYTTPDCKLSIMESKWGLIPDMSISITLRELLRMDIAKELTMTGRIVSGTEAEKIGLVTRSCGDPMEEAIRVAKEIVSRSPDSVAATKKLYQDTWVANEDTCLKVETALQKKLLLSWNQLAASGRNFGVSVPYAKQKDMSLDEDDLK